MTTALAILKTFARYLGYAVLALVCLLVLALLFVGFTPVGARLAADQVAKLASTPDRQVVLGTPSGLLSGHLRLDSVVVSDTKGPYAELRDIAVDWSPLSLLTATFHAEQVSAGLVSVERPPVVTETPSSSSDSSSGGLPVAIRIERMQFPDIRLGAALAGDAYRLQARGTLTAERDRIESALDVNRADLAQAGAHVVFAFAPAENRLDLDAKVAEPAGGLVAGLLRLPGRPALSFDISGAGPLSDWSGKLSAALDGKPVLAVDGRHQGTTDGGHHLIVKGGGSFDSVLPPVFRPLFAGTTDIDLSAALTTDGRLTVDNGRLTTGSLDLTATGTFDPKGDNDLSARLTGKAGPVDFRWPLAEGEARVLIDSATLAVTGPANAAKLDLAAALTSLDLPQGHLGGLHADVVEAGTVGQHPLVTLRRIGERQEVDAHQLDNDGRHKADEDRKPEPGPGRGKLRAGTRVVEDPKTAEAYQHGGRELGVDANPGDDTQGEPPSGSVAPPGAPQQPGYRGPERHLRRVVVELRSRPAEEIDRRKQENGG